MLSFPCIASFRSPQRRSGPTVAGPRVSRYLGPKGLGGGAANSRLQLAVAGSGAGAGAVSGRVIRRTTMTAMLNAERTAKVTNPAA